ncbi:hypothetical protein QFW77_00885 [Luteimonas sp. RD2P54]|uniref:Uncharacterized protein n=1 Tax=Luteimonas endophytica TaxID=3042023 RepID=A0ABT6J404_9GAMM|nr:hypothetical protein [Luteimonas endophytica]MDH5821550.1 hypothetical protein [Luteimonas endophytica]
MLAAEDSYNQTGDHLDANTCQLKAIFDPSVNFQCRSSSDKRAEHLFGLLLQVWPDAAKVAT